MTFSEFKFLSEALQTELVWSEGDFVADRQVEERAFLLYQLYSFYVEVAYFGSVNTFKIHRSFNSTDHLELTWRRLI
jgi:hypothetical protein